MLADTVALQEALTAEMRGRIQEADEGVPTRPVRAGGLFVRNGWPDRGEVACPFLCCGRRPEARFCSNLALVAPH